MFIRPVISSGGGIDDPTDIANLVLWLDGSDATTLYQTAGSQPFGLGSNAVTSTGDYVGCWADKSGNDYHMNQSDTGRRPQYNTNIANSLSAIEAFGSSPAYKLYSTSSVLTQDDEVTIFYVANRDANESYGVAYCNSNTYVPNGAKISSWVDTRSANKLGMVLQDSTTVNVAANPADIGTEFNLFSQQITGGDIIARLNGTAGTAATIAGNGITENDYTRIFCEIDDGNPLDGYICELIIYDTALSQSDIDLVEEWLQSKWATPALP